MKKTIAVLLLLVALPAYGAEPVSRKEIEMELMAVRAEKEKHIARYNWGQTMVEEAGRQLPGLAQRESELTKALEQLDGAAAKAKAEKAPPAAKAKP